MATSAATGKSGRFTATPLTAQSSAAGPKSVSGKRAVSSKALLRRTDAKRVPVVVKLDYDAAASYTGGLRGLPATSPRVTGRKLTGRSAAERAYDRYARGMERTFRAALAKQIPSAVAGASLRRVYGGLAVTLPADKAKALLVLPGVAAVQADSLRHVDAAPVEGPTFIGAPTIWKQEGGQTLAGRGVIFADLDTGIWPEHPMLAANPALGSPPAAPSGVARKCIFGDNPLTPATDVFQCNDKVIGGAPFLATYNANNVGEVYPDSARDSNGHGTHTTTTAAGDAVTSAPVLGSDQGPISGVAPGAWVLEYKVCGLQGCYSSDSAAAVQQAILDGASVINFSISGGANPYSDPVETAFLDAYEAGVVVAASAGNSGPAAATTDHRGPWTITVAASTQTREFRSTLSLTSATGSATFTGTSLTQGVGPAPVVLSQSAPYSDEFCNTAAAPGVLAGKIVACRRGVNGRVQKGYNVKQGGAVGMILYNLPLADTESDNHWLPAIHLADGTEFVAYLSSHTDVTGSFTAGMKANGQGDVMAAFSSRGPGGQFLKPDITAPGVQVLAGQTPTPDEIAAGPPGQYYQAIAGTSMSSPHIAGSAILVKALHPSWTPGAIKSALMTTATTKVVKQDLVTPADPFDMGSGRVDLTRAGKAPIVFDETGENMATLGKNPQTAVDLNLPSINVPTMPGTVTVTRTATNVSGKVYRFSVRTSSPRHSTISVSPRSGTIGVGQTRTFIITITSDAPSAQYFGQIKFISAAGPQVHLPVAFFNQQGEVALTQACDPATIVRPATTTCTVDVQNNSAAQAAVVATSAVDTGLKIIGANGARVAANGRSATAGPVTLAAPQDATPAIAPGTTPGGGFLDLSLFGIAPSPIGDEAAQNYTIPGFLFGGKTYTEIGVVSDGYLVLGGSNGNEDISFQPQDLPDPARPNGVLAPYWTDLDGTAAPGIRVGSLSDSVNTWIVVQWNVNLYGTTTQRAMQVWIGVNGTEDISYGYDAGTIGAAGPADPGLTVGVENVTGTKGAQVVGAPGAGYVVTTTPGVPGGTLSYSLVIKGQRAGRSALTTTMDSDAVVGDTRVITPIKVK